jgi:hypothetical protein
MPTFVELFYNNNYFRIIQFCFMRKLFLFIIAILFSQSILAQSVTVTQPNGGELMYGCQPYTIKWTSSGVSNN